VPTYRVTYRPDLRHPAEDVDADRVTVQPGSGQVLLHTSVLVIGQPREIVVRRLRGEDVLSVEQTS
jgi:hypothetical protein